MSWSVGVKSLPAKEAAAEIEKQFEAGSKCAEPEETIRQAARKLIAETIAAQDVKLSVSAYGSQSSSAGVLGASLGITITPEW